MTPFAGRFTLPRLERVIAGPGTIDALAGEIDRYGCRRVVVVTGTTLGSSPLIDRVRRVLGDRCAAVFSGARQHVPSSTIPMLLDAMRDAGADGFVSVGGGSPIDTVKCAVHALIGGTPLSAGDGPLHIAVPTTLSAGEFTDVAGLTDEETRVKHSLFDTRLAPRVVIADRVLTLDTPDWLWAASGIRAFDHAIETLYAGRRHPISEALAERALEMLRDHLPGSVHAAGDARLTHRGECQMAAWLAVFGVTNAGFGLSHVLGHQIGPRWHVAHGVTSAIMLPHAMRFMADAAPERFAPIARALGVAGDDGDVATAARACADRAGTFIAQFGLPARLRDVLVPRAELTGIAALVSGLMARAQAVERPVTPADVEIVLEAGY